MSLKLNRSMRITIGIGLALVLMQGVLSYVIVDSFRSATRVSVKKQPLVTTLAHQVDDKVQEHMRRNLLIALSCTMIGSCLALCFIGGRMRGEVARRAEAEDYAGLLLESVGEGVLGVNEAGIITFVNKAAVELLGYHSANELLGRDARESLHHGKPDCPKCERDRCLIYPVIASGTSRHSENESLWRKDRSSFVADFSCISVWSAARLRGAVLTFRDVSERREIQERLRLQGAALEAAANSILIADREDNILWVNESFTRVTGFSRQEAIGQKPHALLAGRHDEKLFRELAETIKSKKAWQGEMVTRRRDGALYDDEVTITPVLDEDGEITHFIGIMQDVTGRKRSEKALLKSNLALKYANEDLVRAKDRANELALKAERANEAKSEFLANMSHEIRTPMNAIIGVGNLLQYTELSTQQKDYLQTLDTSAELLLCIINDVLDFSKIEAGKLEISSIDFPAQEVVRDIVAVFAVRAEEKGIELRMEFDGAIPRRLVGDPQRLAQILNNLLGNALKFTRQGSIVLTVAIARRSAEGVELDFQVRDSGIGICAENQAQLFQPFTQLDGSITRTYGGTGLGLAICKQLTSLLGGGISCQSSPGAGSTFTFRLPFAVAVRQSAALLSSSAPGSLRFSGQRILVVEDNVFNQKVAVALLERGGLAVTVAGNGWEALVLIREEEFDLVLMDVQMPVMDGLTAAREIRKLEKPGAGALPILAVSANAMPEDVKQSLAAGMNAHLTKPYNPEALYRSIGLWLGMKGNDEGGSAPAQAGGSAPGDCGKKEMASRLDVETGIRQTGASRDLYLDLLGRFELEYSGKGEEIRREVGSGNVQQASRIAHSVKGIAGVLAAMPLHGAAQRMEAALGNGDRSVEPLLVAFEDELAATLVCVRQALPRG